MLFVRTAQRSGGLFHVENLACHRHHRGMLDRVRVVECAGRAHAFRALNRKGNRATVCVNSRSRAIWHWVTISRGFPFSLIPG